QHAPAADQDHCAARGAGCRSVRGGPLPAAGASPVKVSFNMLRGRFPFARVAGSSLMIQNIRPAGFAELCRLLLRLRSMATMLSGGKGMNLFKIAAIAVLGTYTLAGCTSQSTPPPPTVANVGATEGTVTFTGGAVAVGIGFQWGSGTLTYQG